MTERIPAFSETWTRPERWPFDTPDAVCLPRGLNMIGQALFEEWEGVEFGLLSFSPPRLDRELPLPFIAPTPSQQEAKEALYRADPGARELEDAAISAQLRYQAADKLAKLVRVQPYPTAGASGRLGTNALTGRLLPNENALTSAGPETAEDRLASAAHAARAAKAAFDARYESAALLLAKAEAPYAQRAAEIRRLVIQALISGELAAKYRWDGDGELYDCPPSWWNAEHDYVGRRFLTCKIDPQNPTRPRATPEWSWLYLCGAPLDAFVARHQRNGDASQSAKPFWPSAGEPLGRWLQNNTALQEEIQRRVGTACLLKDVETALTEIWNEAPSTRKKYKVSALAKAFRSEDLRHRLMPIGDVPDSSGKPPENRRTANGNNGKA